MAHFIDLGTDTQMVSGSRIRAVGWLSAEHPFPTGSTSQPFVERLRSLCSRWRDAAEALRWPVAGGVHTCDLCHDFGAAGNVGVPAGGVLFVAPEMVAHYVEKHGYLPPAEFVQAVLAAPEPGTAAYAIAVAPFISDLHLFAFGYTSPAEIAWVASHPGSDLGEFSELVFIRAASSAEAEMLGQDFAEAFVRACFTEDGYSWRELQFASWIEDDPETIAWAVENHVPCIEATTEVEAVAKSLAARTTEGDTT